MPAMLVNGPIDVQNAIVARQGAKDSFWPAVHGPSCHSSISFEDVEGSTQASLSRRPSSAKHVADHET